MPTSKSVSSNFYLSFFKFLSGNILLDLILTMQISYSISTLRFFPRVETPWPTQLFIKTIVMGTELRLCKFENYNDSCNT